jgi:uncharacterized protein (DUF58 family)
VISAELMRQIRRLHLYARRLAQGQLGGAYHTAFKGTGLIFEEVRDYQPGDDIRTIDWNVTARMGRPFIKRFREERETTVLLVVDVSASLRFGSTGRTKRQAAAEVAALLALCAAVNNDRVGAVLGTTKVERFVAPAKGARHLQRLLRDLLVFEPTQRGTNLSALLQFVLRTQRRHAIVVLISDFLTQHYGDAFLQVARQHDLITICLVDPCEQECPPWGLVHLEDSERGVQLLVDTADIQVRRAFAAQMSRHRELLRRIATQAGVDVLTLSPADGYVQSLVRYLDRRRRWRHRR